ncbi:GMC oxidoreductase [Amniculicola lignicola CBS 123094]|uniref:GMC oxidoreductase n=1 Tax=Amniculicola lignicola CBS 123094 TaxID=1392246 RepID=A0A6A5X355_9PLEO|nr:GMC oxidoreductase [Amniculicola lignicola CBS 123094]
MRWPTRLPGPLACRLRYQKFETYNAPSTILSDKINNKYIDPSLRGTSGPIETSFCEADFAWHQDAWPKTCINAGYPQPCDPRTGSALGGFNQLTTVDPKTVQRSYSASAYYEPNASRSNLSVLTNALVAKIEFDKSGYGNAKATGVQFMVENETYTVRANKEVIVCGGVVKSPQLLELSGIGSSALLQRVGVDILVDNPGVGENLNDHAATAISLAVKDEYPTGEVVIRSPEIAQQAMEAYLTHKTGPFTNAPTTTGFASLAMVDPDLKNPKEHINALVAEYHKANPDKDLAGRAPLLAKQLLDPKEACAQIVFLPLGADASKGDRTAELFIHDAPGNWITLGSSLTRAFSRGSVHIDSSDPKVHPLIDPAYLEHPLDIDIAARSVLHSLTLAEYEPLASKLKRDEGGHVILHPGWKGGPIKDMEVAKELVASNTVTQYHPVGTCAMLPREKGGVVDSELRVYGTTNVRVVDASIFPTHVQGNIVSLVYAVAEKGADLIKGKIANGKNGLNGN